MKDIRKKVHSLIKRECCNYIDGYCVALDCICPALQSDIAPDRDLICKWLQSALLPLDPELKAAFTHEAHCDTKQCAVCGKQFVPGSNRAKYCPECSAQARRRKQAELMFSKRHN